MSCKTQTQQIGDHEFSVTQWPADKGVLMKFRLARALGSSLTTIAKLANKKADEAEKIAAFSEGLSELFKHSSPEELSSLIKDCVMGVACDGTRITQTSYNELFSGDGLPLLYKVFFFAVSVNYGNFIPGRLSEAVSAQINKAEQ